MKPTQSYKMTKPTKRMFHLMKFDNPYDWKSLMINAELTYESNKRKQTKSEKTEQE